MERPRVVFDTEDYPLRRFAKGTTILHQGEVPRSATVIKTGTVKAYSISSLGEERIVSFYSTGEVLPTTWLIGTASNSLFYHEAMTDVSAFQIPRTDLLQQVESNEKLRTQLMRYYMSNYVGSLMRITALEQQRAADKIAYMLYCLVMQYGSETKPGVYLIRVHLTHQTFADLVGVTRETASLELHKLKAKKIITYREKEYIVNKKLLVDLIGEDNFRMLAGPGR